MISGESFRRVLNVGPLVEALMHRLDYPWEATDIHEHDRLAEADKAKK